MTDRHQGMRLETSRPGRVGSVDARTGTAGRCQDRYGRYRYQDGRLQYGYQDGRLQYGYQDG